MFQNIGFTELLLIAIVALVLFGPNKLPEIGRVLGRTIRDFKKGAYELMNDEPKAAPVSVAAPVAVQQAPEASPAAEGEAPAAAVADAGRFAPMDKAYAPSEVSSAAPEAVQPPAEKAAVAFVSSAPGPDLAEVAEESATKPATSKPAPAAVQPSSPRRLPD